jgi:hypothetical protein
MAANRRKKASANAFVLSYDSGMGPWARNAIACVNAIAIATHTGCSTPATCGAIVSVLPVITVADAATGQPICDALVTASCSDGGLTLAPFGPNGYEVDATVPGCKYGPGLQNGCDKATISVSKSGYETVTVPDVEVRYSTHCPGPVPDAQQVRIELTAD